MGSGWSSARLLPLVPTPSIVSLTQGQAMDTRGVTAHEVGHSLGLDHVSSDPPNPVPKQWLMRDGGDGLPTWTNSLLDPKRF